MTVLDIGNNISVGNSLVPLARSGSADWYAGSGVDTKGCTWAVGIFLNGDVAGGSVNLKYEVQESDTSGGTYTTCKQAGTTDDATTVAAVGVDDAVKIFAINCRNTKRYLRLAVHSSTTASNTTAGCIVLMPNYTGDADAPQFDI